MTTVLNAACDGAALHPEEPLELEPDTRVRITQVTPNSDYTLTLVFTNGKVKIFDVKPYLDKGIFQELRDPALFNSVKPFLGSIQWKNGQDFCPDTLYIGGKSIC